jgi:hypothetical protein
MKADLVSNLLDFEDSAGFVGGKPDTKKSEPISDKQKKQAAANAKMIDFSPINRTIWRVCELWTRMFGCEQSEFWHPIFPSMISTRR